VELLVGKRKEDNAAGGENAFDKIFVGIRHDVSPISPFYSAPLVNLAFL
jgi:hypothetical protein